jgi:hypothetical protein
MPSRKVVVSSRAVGKSNSPTDRNSVGTPVAMPDDSNWSLERGCTKILETNPSYIVYPDLLRIQHRSGPGY